MKKKMYVSVSGGRTSMFMAHWLKENKSDEYDFLFLFANTSREHADTYRFLRAGDEYFNLGLVLVEAVVHHDIKRSCTSRVVTHDTAARDGSVFDEVCRKYGLPNQTFRHCTRELKTGPMDHYAEIAGFGDAEVAIGIRADETRRVSKNATKQRIVYPLVDMIPTTKENVLDFFCQFDWDLRIPEWLGNCVDCHRKSDRKLQAVHRDEPASFEFSRLLDLRYSTTGPNNVPGPRKRYRGYRNTDELIASIADVPFNKLAVTDGGCSESCEVYETEAQ